MHKMYLIITKENQNKFYTEEQICNIVDGSIKINNPQELKALEGYFKNQFGENFKFLKETGEINPNAFLKKNMQDIAIGKKSTREHAAAKSTDIFDLNLKIDNFNSFTKDIKNNFDNITPEIVTKLDNKGVTDLLNKLNYLDELDAIKSFVPEGSKSKLNDAYIKTIDAMIKRDSIVIDQILPGGSLEQKYGKLVEKVQKNNIDKMNTDQAKKLIDSISSKGEHELSTFILESPQIVKKLDTKNVNNLLDKLNYLDELDAIKSFVPEGSKFKLNDSYIKAFEGAIKRGSITLNELIPGGFYEKKYGNIVNTIRKNHTKEIPTETPNQVKAETKTENQNSTLQNQEKIPSTQNQKNIVETKKEAPKQPQKPEETPNKPQLETKKTNPEKKEEKLNIDTSKHEDSNYFHGQTEDQLKSQLKQIQEEINKLKLNKDGENELVKYEKSLKQEIERKQVINQLKSSSKEYLKNFENQGINLFNNDEILKVNNEENLKDKLRTLNANIEDMAKNKDSSKLYNLALDYAKKLESEIGMQNIKNQKIEDLFPYENQKNKGKEIINNTKTNNIKDLETYDRTGYATDKNKISRQTKIELDNTKPLVDKLNGLDGMKVSDIRNIKIDKDLREKCGIKDRIENPTDSEQLYTNYNILKGLKAKQDLLTNVGKKLGIIK